MDGWINQIITYPNITNSPYLTFGLSERPSASGSARMGDSVPSVLKISNLRINQFCFVFFLLQFFKFEQRSFFVVKRFKNKSYSIKSDTQFQPINSKIIGHSPFSLLRSTKQNE